MVQPRPPPGGSPPGVPAVVTCNPRVRILRTTSRSSSAVPALALLLPALLLPLPPSLPRPPLPPSPLPPPPPSPLLRALWQRCSSSQIICAASRGRPVSRKWCSLLLSVLPPGESVGAGPNAASCSCSCSSSSSSSSAAACSPARLFPLLEVRRANPSRATAARLFQAPAVRPPLQVLCSFSTSLHRRRAKQNMARHGGFS